MAKPILFTATAIKNIIQVYDVLKGIKQYTINLGSNTEIMSGPVVTGDRLAVVVKKNNSVLEGRVYTLPKGILSYSFNIK